MKSGNRLILTALAVTFATISTTKTFAINPQPEPPGVTQKGQMQSPIVKKKILPQSAQARVLKGMTANQFKSLAPSTLLNVGGKKVTKSEIVKALNKSRTTAAARSRGESRKYAAELQARQKKEMLIGNSAVKAKFTSFHSVLAKNDKQPARLSIAPQIIEVHAQYDNLMPGRWVAIKGNYFGNGPGKVNLVGNFPGGQLPLIVKAWYNDAVMVEVPMIEGVRDQTATLEVLNSGDLKATHQVQFMATRETKWIPASLITLNSCSTNASFHNACIIETSSTNNRVGGDHQNLPDAASNTSGTDIFTVKPLKNGWRVKNFFDDYDIQHPSVSGNTATFHWTTNPETVTTERGVTLTFFASYYKSPIEAYGPKGVPMQ
jgi:hypothetical protein